MNALTRVGAVSLCALATGWACEPSECEDETPESGLLSDTPRPVLCTTDLVVFSPNRAALASARTANRASVPTTSMGGTSATSTAGEASGGEQEEPGDAVDELEMAVIAQTAMGQPRDTVSLSVQVCGPQALVDLKPAEDDDSRCENLTSTQLQCSTSAAGVARFIVVHGKRGSGTVELCATSHGRHVANAIISVADSTVEDLALRVAIDQLGFGPDASLSCDAADPPQDCGSAEERSTGVRVALLDAAGAEAPVANAQQVDISVRDSSGRANAVGLAIDDCADAGPSVATSVSAGASVSNSVMLCMDGGQTDFELTVTVSGKTRSQQFQVAAVPRSVQIGAADASGTRRLELLDCEESPLANRPFVWRLGTGATQPASTDALGGFFVPAGMGQLEIGVAGPQGGSDFVACVAELGS